MLHTYCYDIQSQKWAMMCYSHDQDLAASRSIRTQHRYKKTTAKRNNTNNSQKMDNQTQTYLPKGNRELQPERYHRHVSWLPFRNSTAMKTSKTWTALAIRVHNRYKKPAMNHFPKLRDGSNLNWCQCGIMSNMVSVSPGSDGSLSEVDIETGEWCFIFDRFRMGR